MKRKLLYTLPSFTERGVGLTPFIKSLLTFFLPGFISLSFSTAFAGTIATDKTDYAPGETVNISGTGWNPGEAVTLQVLHVDGGDNTSSDAHTPWTVNADGDGNLIATWVVPTDQDELGATLQLTATAASGTTSVTFTDGAGNLDQAHNGGIGDPVIDPVEWDNGDANRNNSHFLEGQSMPYRLILSGLDAGTHHEVTIGWDITNSGKNAFDYITSFQRIAETVDPLSGLSGIPNSPSYFPIPAPTQNLTVNSNLEPLTSFNALPASERQMTIFNGTITAMYYNTEGDPTQAQSETRITIEFDVAAGTGTKDVVLSWGGHISSRADWGAGNSAAAIEGSPYHTRFIDLDGKGGNQDMSMKAGQQGPVSFKPTCNVSGPDTVCTGSTNTYTAGTDAPQPGFAWEVSGGASIIGSTTGSTVDVQAPVSGSYTVTVHIADLSGPSETSTCSEDATTTVVTVFTLSHTDYCAGDAALGSVTLSSSESKVSYQLKNASDNSDVQAAQPGTGSALVWTGIPAGTYYVQSASTSATNCTNSTDNTTVTAKPLPTASISKGTRTCAGGIAQFGLTATTNGSIAWSTNGDGSFSSLTAATTTYTPGNNDNANGVTITLTTGLNGCTNSATTKSDPGNCGPLYTYTYCSATSSCLPVGKSKGRLALIKYALDGLDGIINNVGTLYLGRPGASFTAKFDNADSLMKIIPGNGVAGKLAADYDVDPGTSTPGPPLNKNGKIKNGLLYQTIVLDLNTHLQADSIGRFILKPGYLTTQQGDASTCPVTKVLSCSKNSAAISSLTLTTNTTLMNLLNGQTVDSLVRMASKALGGTLPSGVTYADISNAEDVINKSFEGGRFFLGYYTTAQSCSTLSAFVTASATVATNTFNELAVKAYPNPYQDKVNFVFTSPVSGKAVLEAYDLTGKKLAVIYTGNVQAGMEQSVIYNVAAGNRVIIIYKLTVGDKTFHSMLIPGK
jgi:hypothetical protein